MKLLLKILFFRLIFLGTLGAFAQPIQTKIAGQNALVWDPGGPGKKKTIVYYAGLGNEGTNINNLIRTGLATYVNNGSLRPDNAIIICVQQQTGQGWVQAATYEKTLQEIYSKYPVDSFALTGYSAGAYAIFNYIEHRKTNLPICAIVPFSMDFENPNDFTLSRYKDIRVWALSGTGDSRYPNLRKMIDRLSAAGYQAKITGYSGKHCCWPTYYDPAWKENGQNVVDFMVGRPKPPTTVPGSPLLQLDFKVGDTIRFKVYKINHADSTFELIRIKN